MILLRHTDALSVTIRRQAYRLGQKVERRAGDTGSAVEIHGGYICRASKRGSVVTVNIVEPPGQFVGCNDYVADLDLLNGESLTDGIVVATAPLSANMTPIPPGFSTGELNTEERVGRLRTVLPIGDPLPDDPQLLFASYSVEFDGGVLFAMCYGAQDAKDALAAGGVTDQQVWWVFDVRWSGLGVSRSVSISDAYIQSITGSFTGYPRKSPGGPVRTRYGARLPACHYVDGHLTLAIEVEAPGGAGVEVTVGKLLCMGIEYPTVAGETVAAIEWQRIITPDELDPALVPDVFLSEPGGVPYRVSGMGHPSVFSWVSETAGVPTRTCVVSAFGASRRSRTVDAGVTYRKVSGQMMLVVQDGVDLGLQVDFVDSGCGADYSLPQLNAAKMYSMRQRDVFFLSTLGTLVRFRAMSVQVRPPVDTDIGMGGPAVFPIHSDVCYIRTQSAGAVVQLQGTVGVGPEYYPVGYVRPFAPDSTDYVGFSTLAAAGERWILGIVNGTSGAQSAIMAVTPSGVVGVTEAGISNTLIVGVYQQEIKDDSGAVVVPLGAFATLLGSDAKPYAAVKKSRAGVMAFVPAAAYSRWGTFYLGNPIGSQKYGRMFG